MPEDYKNLRCRILIKLLIRLIRRLIIQLLFFEISKKVEIFVLFALNVYFMLYLEADFDERYLLQIIENNPKLNTFIANECNSITDISYKALSIYCKDL